MTWTAPMTAVSGDVFTARDFNMHVRDNLLETEAAKAVKGCLFVTDGANVIRTVVPATASVSSSQSTTSAAFTNLSTVGPRVTLTTGTSALVFISALISNDGSNFSSVIAASVTGATSIDADNEQSAVTDGIADYELVRIGMTIHYDNLTPGSNTFTMKYRVAGGTATYGYRTLSVLPI